MANQVVKIDLEKNNSSNLKMVNHSQNFQNQVKEEFQNYYNENWDGGDWDDFKEEAKESLWNSYYNQTIVKDYEAFIIMLDMIKSHYEENGWEFNDYNDPQKVFNLGMYFIATEVLAELNEEDFRRVEDIFVIDDHITIQMTENIATEILQA
jgi:hypothetical protein